MGNIQRSLWWWLCRFSLAAEESSKAAAQSAKELNDALTNESNFPQLSKGAEDEAEVILHKPRRYPYQTLP